MTGAGGSFPASGGRTRLLGVAALVLALVLCLAPLAALAQTFPALTGRVVDAAGLLTPSERNRLEDKLRNYETETSGQIVVVTVPSLGGLAVEDYASRLFNFWGIGQRKKNNGVLLLVALKDRKLRIEIGYGLESSMTNARSKRVLDKRVTPRFQKNDYAGGIEAGIDSIISILGGKYP